MKLFHLVAVLAFLSTIGCQQEPSGNNDTSARAADPSAAAKLVGTALSGEAAAAMLPDGKTLELTIQNSATLNMEPDFFTLHTSRAAWVYFQNAGAGGYERIAVKCHVLDTVATVEYTTAQLATFQERYPIVDAVIAQLTIPNYAGLAPLFDPALMDAAGLSSVQQTCVKNEEEFGKVVSFNLLGFAFFKTSAGQENLAIVGTLRRTVRETPLTLTIDLGKPGTKGALNSMKFAY